mgnify:CR=1 FL=1
MVAISTGTLDLWSIVVSIGIFLLGMHLLEQGLQGIGSKTLKQFLQAQTNSPLKGVFTGTLVTAFLQSSSLVGLIVLAFVGAGMLEMRNALGVILGSNLGTTVTCWMLAVLGFKLDLARFYQPLVAIGAFLTVFLPAGRRPYYLGNLVLGLGLLLMLAFIMAERLGYYFEQPMSNRIFDLPMYRFCSTITGNLLGRRHPLAAPRESEKTIVWM